MPWLTKHFCRGGFCVAMFLCLPAMTAQAEEPTPATVDATKLVTLEQFKVNLPEDASELDLAGFVKLKQQGPFVVLDVRSKDSFAARHLKGSINIPLTDLTETTLLQAVPDKNVPIVLACDYSFFPVRMISMTLQAYPVFRVNGYTQIHRLNLWLRGERMVSAQEQEQALEFEGTSVNNPPR